MEVSVSIDDVSGMPLSRLEEAVAGARKLSDIKIKPNQRVTSFLVDPTVKERRIFVKVWSTPRVPTTYRIEDYAVEEGKVVQVAGGNYTSDGRSIGP